MAERPLTLPPQLESMLLDYTINVLVENPDDLPSHAANYFARLRDGEQPESSNTSDKANIRNILGTRALRRASVQAEQYDPSKEDENEEIEKYEKSKEDRERIKERIQDIFLFRVLDDKDIEQVIDAMQPRDIKEGQIIIRQGDDGDFFYVVDKGTFDAYVRDPSGKETLVSTYDNSGSFGELALLHNQPRAATVRSSTSGKLWAVSRTTFRRLVVKRAYEKRQNYLKLLENVPELKPLTEYEKMQVCDALTPVTLKKNEVLFKEGDEGDGMYFIEEGKVSVRQKSKKKGGEQEMNQLGPGGYIGEMAIVKNQARAASVVAIEDTKLAFLEKKAFERLLGPCVDIMKKRMDTYEKSS